jgi:hypothetical protein
MEAATGGGVVNAEMYRDLSRACICIRCTPWRRHAGSPLGRMRTETQDVIPSSLSSQVRCILRTVRVSAQASAEETLLADGEPLP